MAVRTHAVPEPVSLACLWSVVVAMKKNARFATTTGRP